MKIGMIAILILVSMLIWHFLGSVDVSIRNQDEWEDDE